MKHIDPITILVSIALYIGVLFFSKMVFIVPFMGTFMKGGESSISLFIAILICMAISSFIVARFLIKQCQNLLLYHALVAGLILLVYKLVRPDMNAEYTVLNVTLAMLLPVILVSVVSMVKNSGSSA